MDSKTNQFRAFATPSTWDETTGQVRAILATESPVEVYDNDYGDYIPEILRMDGVVLPPDRALRLVNNHQMRGIENVLGSCTDISTNGQNLETTLVFSPDTQGNLAKTKVKAGHVRDMSVGYVVLEKTIVPPGAMQTVSGRQYTGPVRIATRWEPFEGSLCVIGADANAKTRSKDTANDGAERAGKQHEGAKTVEDNKPKETPTTVATPPAPTVPDKSTAEREERAREDGARAEAARQSEIRSICSQIDGAEELADALCGDYRCTVDMARAKIIDHLRTTKKPLGIAPHGVVVEADERDKFRAAATEAMCRQAGIRGFKSSNVPGADEIRFVSFTALAAECLRRSGINPTWMSKQELISKILQRSVIPQGSADFTNILANVANKAALMPFMPESQTWRAWCRKGRLPDFKVAKRVGLNDFPAMTLTPELAEIPFVGLSDRGENIQLATYTARAGISRQTLIGDDLSEFDKLFANAAARWSDTINSLPYAVLIANAALADTGTLFNATAVTTAGGHYNQFTGAAITQGSLEDAWALMAEQTGPRGIKLNIRPRFLLTGTAYANAAFQNTMSVASTVDNKNSEVRNFYNGITPICDSNITGNKWYLVSGPERDTVEVAFLDGNESLTVSMKDCDDVLGIQYLVYGDAVAKALDFRGMVYNPGA